METKSEYKMTELGKIPVEWEIYPLKELASGDKVNSFIDGDWIESKDMSKEGVRIIQTGNIGIGRFIEKKAKRYISETTFEKLNCKEIYEGDMLICRLADPIGRACLIPAKEERLITSVDITIFRPSKQYDSKYLVYYINSDENLSEVKKYTSGTTRQRISRGNLAKVLIKVPPLKEQQKIAEILSKVDEQIEQTDQLIEKTKELKKGLMQQLLTKGIGHTEFKKSELGEIPTEWKIFKVEDIATVSTGNKDTKDKNDDGIYPFFVRSQTIENINSYSYDGEAILTAGDGVGVGKVFHYIKGKFDFHQRVYKISDFKNMEGKYLYYYFSNNFYNQAMKYNAKTSVDSVRRDMITKMDILVPTISEQKQITSILSSVDKNIEGYEEEKGKYEELKKGLMQQLLTGKTRVKVD